MKKNYSKPQIVVEAFTMDLPIANQCEAARHDMEALLALHFFGESSCTFLYMDEYPAHDTVCYHSNIAQAFLS